MAKLPFSYQKIFGNTGPTGLVSQFGSYKAGAAVYTSNVATIQDLGAWTNGFASAVSANLVPTIQDMNGIFYALSKQIAYLQQCGIPEKINTISYNKNSIVSDGAGTIYMSLVDDNLNNAFTDSTKWFLLHSVNVTRVSDNYTALNTDYIISWHTIGPYDAHRTITLPAASSSLKGRKYIIMQTVNGTADANGRQILVEASGNVINYTVLTYYTMCTVICDGSTWLPGGAIHG